MPEMRVVSMRRVWRGTWRRRQVMVSLLGLWGCIPLGATMKRKYKSGSTWAFWRWTDVDSEYITRLHLAKTPWFSVCLHWLNKPDAEPYLHDHPVSFLSLILRGGYEEERAASRPGDAVIVEHKWFNFIEASKDDCHRITDVKPGTVTLCLMGPKTREWGFHTGSGWVGWKDYYTKQRRERAETQR